MYEEEQKSDKKEVLERLVGENLKVQDLLYRAVYIDDIIIYGIDSF